MSPFPRTRGPRMAKHWHTIPGISIAFTVDNTAAGGGLALDGPFTVLRMLGEYTIAPTSAPTIGDKVTIGFGIGVVSSDAFAVGGSAMPDPVTTDQDYPWLYWADHDFFFPVNSVESALATTSLRRAFDIKSMRKMKPRETLAMVIQYVDSVGAPPITVEASQTRVLVAT